jgi:hypothetical protein
MQIKRENSSKKYAIGKKLRPKQISPRNYSLFLYFTLVLSEWNPHKKGKTPVGKHARITF